jgi:Tol biopolymer transport system component
MSTGRSIRARRWWPLAAAVALIAGVLAAPSATAAANFTLRERLSESTDGVQADAEIQREGVSADGRYVVMRGYATNLVAGDTNADLDVFLHDRWTGTTTRVSVDSDDQQGDGASYNADVSSAGPLVVFSSDATNLVPNDTNGQTDVFLRDVDAGTTTRLSVASDGTQATGGSSSLARISADGTKVVFRSRATNIVRGGHQQQFRRVRP